MRTLLIGVLLSCVAVAQSQLPQRRPFVRAVGEASVPVAPDQAVVSVGVVTQAPRAEEAVSQNATQVAAVLTQLRQLLGATADLRTVGYSLTPVQNFPGGGAAPVVVGYQASNTVEVVTENLTLIGRVIDTATQAGANRVLGLRFALKDDQAVRSQALRTAGARARAKAESIAAGLGVRLGAVLSAQEGAEVRVDTRLATLGAATPIEPGTVIVNASVTLELEIAQ